MSVTLSIVSNPRAADSLPPCTLYGVTHLLTFPNGTPCVLQVYTHPHIYKKKKKNTHTYTYNL